MEPSCNVDPETAAPQKACHNSPRTEMCGKQKFEPQNADLLICNTKNCQIYGGHDTEPFPNYPCPARVIKAKDPNKNSLGSPVGMIASSINFKSEGKPSDIAQARYATYLKAFARLYLNPEFMWTTELLDDIMREGLTLYSQSEKDENQLESPPQIYTESERKIQREFQMSGCTFHVELMKKFRLDDGAKGDGVNAGHEDEMPLGDLKKSLKKFFQHHKHVLLAFGNAIYVLMWRSQRAYMVLDVCGRRLDFHSDREKGMAMLVCLKTLENVRHLLVGLTNLAKIDSFSLREMKMVKVLMPSGEVVQRDYGLRQQQWELVNDDYAYLKASLHLSLNPKEFLRNRSALPTGVMAIVLSKIDHPATWSMKILDKILCFGVRFCQACWAACPKQNPEGINAMDFPTLFDMAQFRIRIELQTSKYQGLWRCIPGYRHSELAESFQKAFSGGQHKLLLQINYQLYAIWKKNDFIYLLDPFRHRILGQPVGGAAEETFEEMEKSASLRMFASFPVFMNTLNHVLLDSNRNSRFQIHSLRILRISKRDRPAGFGNDAMQEDLLPTDVDVKSLNEHVCFEESDDFCQKLLAEISDYEDEDLLSDVDELELRTSSSEGEEGLEEEEAGQGGEEEEMEGLESSSSGDEDTNKNKREASGKSGKKKGKNNKKGGKNNKGGKASKGGDTGDKQRKKAGESVEDEVAPNEAMSHKDKQNEGKEKQKNEKPQNEKKSIEASKLEGQEKAKDTSKMDENKEKKEDANKSPQDKKTLDKNPAKEVDNLAKENKITEDKNKQDMDKQSKSPPDAKDGKEKPSETPTKNKANKPGESNLMPPRDHNEGPSTESPKKSNTKSPYPKTSCGHEADDEKDEEDTFDIRRYCTSTKIPDPNRYPGYFKCPLDMAVVGSENGSYESLSKLLRAGFSRADRLLAMTPTGNFVVFRCMCHDTQQKQQQQQGVIETRHLYYLFDGCTCNVNRFRHLDLSLGTAGLLCFKQLHDVIEYMRQIRMVRAKENRCKRLVPPTADEICQEFCG